MTAFDLDITAVNVPANFETTAGSSTMREVAVLQEGAERNYLKLSRALTEPREFLRRLGDRIFDREACAMPFGLADGRPRPTVA